MWHAVGLPLLLLSGGILLELGCPVWFAPLAVPCFLGVAWICICLSCGSGAILFWSGLAGLATDLIRQSPLGNSTLLLATVGLGWIWVERDRLAPRGWGGRIFACCLLATVFECVQLTGAVFQTQVDLTTHLPRALIRGGLTAVIASGLVMLSAPRSTDPLYRSDISSSSRSLFA